MLCPNLQKIPKPLIENVVSKLTKIPKPTHNVTWKSGPLTWTKIHENISANYSITELELLGLCVNISQFLHLLTKVDFDCTEDHFCTVALRPTLWKAKVNQSVQELKCSRKSFVLTPLTCFI